MLPTTNTKHGLRSRYPLRYAVPHGPRRSFFNRNPEYPYTSGLFSVREAPLLLRAFADP